MISFKKVIKKGVASFLAFAFVSAMAITSNTNMVHADSQSMISLSLCGKVNGNDVNIRKDASTNKKAIDKIGKNKKVSISGITGNWYRINVEKTSGYILAKYVDVKVTTTTTVNFRSEPSTNKKIITTIDKNKTLKVIGYYRVSDTLWYKVNYNSKTGFVCAKYLKSYYKIDTAKTSTTASTTSTTTKATTKSTTKSTTQTTKSNSVTFADKTSKTVKASVDAVALRERASSNSKKIISIPKNTKLSIINEGSNGKWWHASVKIDGKSYTGYVYKTKTKESWTLSESDYNMLCKIVMAEAGNEPNKGIKLLAQAMLDRASYYNSFSKACNQVCSNNRYAVTKEVKNAVNAVLSGERVTSEKVIYWYNPKACRSSWHESLHFVTEVGGHRFFNDF